MTMKAMLFAAGLGTRLKPLTDQVPKALVVYKGKTLLEHSLDHLQSAGVTQVIINVHHLADQILGFLQVHRCTGLEIAISDERDELLDTGGGLKKAGWFFSDGLPFIARNIDVISDLSLPETVRFHNEQKCLATLVVRQRETSRYLLFDEHGDLCGWKNLATTEEVITRTGKSPLTPYAFSGIQVLSPQVLPLITESGKFSLVQLYLRLAKDHAIKAYIDRGSTWQDVGKPSTLDA